MITVIQHVHHGPLGFYNGWHIAFPVAAIVDTDPPEALQTNLDKVFGDAPIVISTVVGMGGTLDTYISRATTERADPAFPLLTTKFGWPQSESASVVGPPLSAVTCPASPPPARSAKPGWPV